MRCERERVGDDTDRALKEIVNLTLLEKQSMSNDLTSYIDYKRTNSCWRVGILRHFVFLIPKKDGVTHYSFLLRYLSRNTRSESLEKPI